MDETGGTGGGSPAGGTGPEPPACPKLSCANAGEQNRTCEDGESFTLGSYQILNNLWGSRGTGPNDGQCSSALCSTGTAIAWTTSFTWTAGDPESVKSYAAAILGWHWNEIPSGSPLPIQLSALPPIECTWTFQVTADQDASLNVAYDLWLYTSAGVDRVTSPTDEIMVWLYRWNKEDPIGEFEESVTLAGSDWDLYTGSNGSNQVYSFLRAPSTGCATVDLAEFLRYLISSERVDPNKYLISIEAGPEVVMGRGEVRTDFYACEFR